MYTHIITCKGCQITKTVSSQFKDVRYVHPGSPWKLYKSLSRDNDTGNNPYLYKYKHYFLCPSCVKIKDIISS